MERAPPVLIFRGRLELFQRPMISLVGARNASAAACRFSRGLAQRSEERRVGIECVSTCSSRWSTCHTTQITDHTILTSTRSYLLTTVPILHVQNMRIHCY